MFRFVYHQSHISEKNINRLRAFLEDPDEGVRIMADVVIRVAVIRPFKRKRVKYLVKVNQALAKEFVETFFPGGWVEMQDDGYNENSPLEGLSDGPSEVVDSHGWSRNIGLEPQDFVPEDTGSRPGENA